VRVHWFRVFDQALRSSEVIAVWRVVEDHLERPLTRVELTAARRAANRYAAASRIRMVRVPAPAGSGGIRTIPLLARSDADLGDIERLTAIASGKMAAGPHRGRPTKSAGQRAEALVATVSKAGRAAHPLRTGRIDRELAATLADELSGALAGLQDLEQRLRLRGERTRQASGVAAAEAPPGPGLTTA